MDWCTAAVIVIARSLVHNYSAMHQDFLALCMLSWPRALCSAERLRSHWSVCSVHPFCPELSTPLLYSAPNQNWLASISMLQMVAFKEHTHFSMKWVLNSRHLRLPAEAPIQKHQKIKNRENVHCALPPPIRPGNRHFLVEKELYLPHTRWDDLHCIECVKAAICIYIFHNRT